MTATSISSNPAGSSVLIPSTTETSNKEAANKITIAVNNPASDKLPEENRFLLDQFKKASAQRDEEAKRNEAAIRTLSERMQVYAGTADEKTKALDNAVKIAAKNEEELKQYRAELNASTTHMKLVEKSLALGTLIGTASAIFIYGLGRDK